MKSFIQFVLCLSLVSCTSNEKESNQGFQMNLEFINEAFKDTLNKLCVSNYSDSHIYVITFCRLYRTTIAYIQPEYDNELIKSRGKPFISYAYSNNLFVIYTGFESLIRNSKNDKLIQVMYDSVCNKYGYKPQTTIHDIKPLFFEIKENDLVEYNNESFATIFMEQVLDTSTFVPPKLE